MTHTPLSGIAEAAALAGGPSCLADRLGLPQRTIYNWLRQGYVPLKQVARVAELTGIDAGRLADSRYLAR